MGKYSPGEAKRLYEELADHTDTVGHAACADPFTESLLRFTERTTAVSDDFDEMEDDPKQDTDDGPPRLRVHVSSPWHAVFHLSCNNRGWLEGRQGPVRTPLIYRGQRDSRWSIAPSLERQGTDRAREEQHLRSFCSTVRDCFNRQAPVSTMPRLGGDVLSDSLLEATAQHYGIRTRLLDFTSDEAVAVWFACQGGSRGEIASVFALPLVVGGLCEVKFLLCHFLALRPYRQHGLFLEDPLGQLKRLLIEVRFPIDPNFQLKRDRLPTALYPEDEWWEDVVSAIREGLGPPSLNLSSNKVRERVDESLLNMLQMMMELTTLDISQTTSFNHDVIKEVASQNPKLFLASEERCRMVSEEHFRGTMGQFVVPKMLDWLRNVSLQSRVESSRDVSAEVEIFKKWLPTYIESAGGILRSVPTDVARKILEICRQNQVGCEAHPEGAGKWIIVIKGARAKSGK